MQRNPRQLVVVVITAVLLCLAAAAPALATTRVRRHPHCRVHRTKHGHTRSRCRRRARRRTRRHAAKRSFSAHSAAVKRVMASAAARREGQDSVAPTTGSPAVSTSTTAAGSSGVASGLLAGSTAPESTSSASWTCGWGSFSGPRTLPGACWRPFSDGSWLNTPLPSSPRLLPDSSTLVANMMSSSTGNGDGTVHSLYPIPSSGDDYYHPYYFSSAGDPRYTISCTRNCNLAGQDLNGQQVRIPCGARAADGSDHHLAVLDQAAGVEYDFFDVQTNLSSCGGGTLTVAVAGEVSENGDARGTCADAVCVALTAGIIREQELAAGAIDHALFMVSHTCNGTAVYPGESFNSCGGVNSTAPAEGQWFRLDLSPAQIQALPRIASWQKTILTAMSVYGMFVGDQGSNGAFELQTESPATYAGASNPWLTWAKNQQSGSNVSVSGSQVSLEFGNGLPASFWTQHLQAVAPCVIQRTCV